jgi:Putative polyhydroxyalkanoic acid system protein (PHA_gran_rgn)
MPGIKISVSHQLGQEQALQRLRSIVQDLQKQFADKVSKVEEVWSESGARFSFEVMGFPVSGTLNVQTESVQLEGKIPLLAMPFKDKIETTIRKQMKFLLA